MGAPRQPPPPPQPFSLTGAGRGAWAHPQSSPAVCPTEGIQLRLQPHGHFLGDSNMTNDNAPTLETPCSPEEGGHPCPVQMLGMRTHVRSHYHASEGGTQGLNPVPTVSLRPHQHEGPNTSGPLAPRRDPPPVSHCPSKPPGPPGLRPWGRFVRDPPTPTLPPGCQPCKDTTQTSVSLFMVSPRLCLHVWLVCACLATCKAQARTQPDSSRVFQKSRQPTGRRSSTVSPRNHNHLPLTVRS